MRRKILEDDLVEGVIGLGPNLFYNSAMEACVLVLNKAKLSRRKRKVVLVDGRKQVELLRNHAQLRDEHVEKLLHAFLHPESHQDIARNLTLEEVADQGYSLHMALYFKGNDSAASQVGVEVAVAAWQDSRASLRSATEALFNTMEEAKHV